MNRYPYQRVKTGIVLDGVELVVGNVYHVMWSRKWRLVRLIQVTQYGYNFYYPDEYRCILKRHLYVPRKLREKYSDYQKLFLVSQHLVIRDPNE